MSYAKLAQIRIGIKCGGCARSFRHPPRPGVAKWSMLGKTAPASHALAPPAYPVLQLCWPSLEALLAPDGSLKSLWAISLSVAFQPPGTYEASLPTTSTLTSGEPGEFYNRGQSSPHLLPQALATRLS
jgi:hypothetical protein